MNKKKTHIGDSVYEMEIRTIIKYMFESNDKALLTKDDSKRSSVLKCRNCYDFRQNLILNAYEKKTNITLNVFF